VLLLATEVWKSHGGIQRYMRMIGRILTDRGEPFAVLSLLDSDDNRPLNALGSCTMCCKGSKRRFCVQAFRLARTRIGRATIVGHVGLLPLAWCLKQIGLIDRYAVVLHGIEAWHRLPWITRGAARQASTIVATTQYTLREFCFHNQLESSKCIVIPLASDFRTPVSRRRLPTRDLKMLTVTRLSKSDTYKGVETILIALKRGRDTGLAVTLSLVGDGDDRSRLETLARSLDIQDSVRFHGSVQDEALESLIAESHVFVMPSKKEGFGIVFVEAMTAGLPCIGANHGGTPEVIQHGENGFLIEYGDADQLLFYLRVLIESPPLYETMSNAARRTATESLSFNVMAPAWGRLMASLTTSKSSAHDSQPRAVAEETTELPSVAE
jgi:phosphatidylinositol alpha-1,6-mannosyltransferase